MRYAYRKQYTWTSALAYCAGLIATDGCLSSDKRHIDLTSKDKDLLLVFKDTLSIKANIGIKPNGQGGKAYRIQFGDVALYDFLLSAGLTPRKSLTIGELCIPDEFYADFLRGCFDGDGSTYSFWDKRWKSSFMFYVSFGAASKSFLDWLTANNSRLIGTTSVRPLLKTRVWQIAYAKSDAKKLFDYMYSSKDAPRLARKHARLVDFIGVDSVKSY